MTASTEALYVCSRCLKAQPEDQFGADLPRPERTCKTCWRTMPAGGWKGETAAQVRRRNLWAKYRITVEEYDALRVAQNFRCAICGIHENDIAMKARGRPRKDGAPPATSAPLAVDHCHSTGAVRGLLCPGCNTGLGCFKDRPDLLKQAIEYLVDR